ncbi:MAG: enoyl-CoA hydratase/isomerase family protein [Gammaproteobacteria bacterium]
MDELVLREERDGLCTLTLNRPAKLNALGHASFVLLEKYADDIARSTDRIGCVVLRGAGRSFCAGHDLDDIASGAETGAVVKHESLVVERLANLPQPLIVAVHGHCMTGGLELALAGDIIIAAESAKFADTHAKWDLVPVWGLSQRLPRRVGRARAVEMMFASRTYSGRQAEAMGLANFCVPDADFDAAVEAFAREILANAWRANRENKKLVADTDGMELQAGLAHEVFRSAGRGPEMPARIARMRQKK